MPRIAPVAQLRHPERIDKPGLLVGWSLELEHRRTPIGFNFGDPLRAPETGYLDPILLHGEGHLLTIAPTGAGKGTGCIVPALLRYPGPVIVIDPKGENVAITARRRREMGQRVVVLDPMGLTDHAGDRFNPLDIVDVEQSTAVDDVVALCRALLDDVDDDPRSRYWVNRAQHLVVGVALAVLQRARDAREAGSNGPESRASLAEVRELVNQAAAGSEALASLMDESRHPEVARIGRLLNIRAPETLGGIVSYAQEAVDFLRGDALLEHVGGTSFDPADVTGGAPLSIFLVLPPHMLESHGRLLRLWLTAFVTLITRRNARPRHSTLLLLDEAAQLGALPHLRQAITLLRGYGLQTWSFWQDVSQLQTLYPRDWKTMVNNCKVLQCFGALNQAAAQDMADLTGFGDGDAVLDLDHDEMLLQVAGDQAVVAQLPNYLTDPTFAGQFDRNPYHEAGRSVMPRRGPPQRLYVRPGDPGDDEVAFAHVTDPSGDALLDRLLQKWKE